MDILVFTREHGNTLEKHTPRLKGEVLGMKCYNFGNNLQALIQIANEAFGRDLTDFLTENRYIYLDGFLRICDET